MVINTSTSTDLNGNTLTVNVLNSKTLDNLFSYDFTVYAGFDKKGLIEDALFMYKRTLKLILLPTKKNIESPEKLYELFTTYKKECKNNPIKKMDFKGKDAERVYYLLERPLSMVGFDNYVFTQGIIYGLKDYFGNYNDAYSEYSNICSRIKSEIRADQVDGGMAGIYNPSITQRLNNLVEKTDVTTKGKEINVVSLGNGVKPNE